MILAMILASGAGLLALAALAVLIGRAPGHASRLIRANNATNAGTDEHDLQ
jgi:hypothetical protein